MARGLAEAIALFALPFAIYALALLVQRRLGLLGPNWTGGRLALLGVAGLLLVLTGLVVVGLVAPRREGAYLPAHLVNGRLIPGVIR